MLKRLTQWHENWPGIQHALQRNCHIDPTWEVTPWLFVPEDRVKVATAGLDRIGKRPCNGATYARPTITTLESVLPWKYTSWDRQADITEPKSESLPLQR